MMRTPSAPGILFFLAFIVVAIVETGSAAQEVAFRFKEVSHNSLGIFEGAKPVLVYNHGQITNAAFPKAAAHSAYIHSIHGLDGEALTGDFPKDHVYHRGLYWAWPHIQIAGKEYDSWSLRGIEQKFENWLGQDVTSSNATLVVENTWVAGGKKVMREVLTLQVHRANGESRSIDVELAWTPLEQPITLRGANEKSYGGLTMRFADRTKTIITIPTGRTEEDLVVAKLPWADFTANFNKEMSGASIFVHPDHLKYPPEWMVRHYGVLAVGMPGVKPKTFAPNETFTSRYRIWIHRGNPDAAAIQREYDKYFSQAKGDRPSAR